MRGRRFGLILAGTVVCGIGIRAFIEPAHIAPGGASGAALMIHFLTGVPVGLLILFLNIPLLVLAWFFLSRRFAVLTAGVSVLSAVILDGIITPFCPVYDGSRLLGSLYGGVLAGGGMALVFLAGASTGGTDILGYLLQKKRPHISIGRALLMVDGVILAVSVAVFGDVESALFGLIALYAQTRVVDSVLYGASTGRLVFVVTAKPERLIQRIICEVGRTATVLPGQGAYSGKKLSLLLCTVKKAQFEKLKTIIREGDPEAFVVAAEASEVLNL